MSDKCRIDLSNRTVPDLCLIHSQSLTLCVDDRDERLAEIARIIEQQLGDPSVVDAPLRCFDSDLDDPDNGLTSVDIKRIYQLAKGTAK